MTTRRCVITAADYQLLTTSHLRQVAKLDELLDGHPHVSRAEGHLRETKAGLPRHHLGPHLVSVRVRVRVTVRVKARASIRARVRARARLGRNLGPHRDVGEG